MPFGGNDQMVFEFCAQKRIRDRPTLSMFIFPQDGIYRSVDVAKGTDLLLKLATHEAILPVAPATLEAKELLGCKRMCRHGDTP